ncbi:MAG: basic amino acid ABC transporter substrate-binding protein [Oscillospiraceae bacterium]|jgi:polar amino acid transport system substrate-binding protein|nr:basic amino acid ABC transporter substrate-binding protein [Oscillospiraceae bacterium]
MKKLKALLAVALAAAMIVPFAACSKNSDTVTMSTNAEFEPFEYKDNDKIVGIDVEIANKIASKLGKKLKINDVAFDSLVTELKSGKCDFVAAGMSVTDDRKVNADFSDPYFDATQSIIVLKGSPIKTRTDLNGKKVGVQQGTTGDTFCTNEDGKSDIKVGSVQRFNKGADAVTDLLNGKLDAVVIDDFPAQKFVSKNSGKIEKLQDALTVEHYAIAVKKGNTELLNTINGVLKDMKSSGDLDKLISKYKSALEGD